LDNAVLFLAVAVESLVQSMWAQLVCVQVAGELVGYSQYAHMAVGCVAAVLMSPSASIPLGVGPRRADGHLLIARVCTAYTLSTAHKAHALNLLVYGHGSTLTARLPSSSRNCYVASPASEPDGF